MTTRDGWGDKNMYIWNGMGEEERALGRTFFKQISELESSWFLCHHNQTNPGSVDQMVAAAAEAVRESLRLPGLGHRQGCERKLNF